MKKITILGANGFIGSHFANYLLSKNNFKVVLFDLKKNKEFKKNKKMIIGSILDEKKLEMAIKKSDYVFNFAALADLNDAREKPLETALINVVGTIKALIACRKFNIKKFIHASSIYANSEQGGFYGSSKKAAEDYIEKFQKKYKLKFTILRFGSLYGNGADKNNGINIIIDHAIKSNTLLYRGNKKSARRYIHVSDACKACEMAIKKEHDNKYLNVTGKNKIRISNVLNMLSIVTKIPKNKIVYKNYINEGHYINEPKKFIPRQGTNLYLKKYKNFKEGIFEQYLERKKKFVL